MTISAVVGAQWGDEGKGRIVDVLAQEMDWVIRFQGGDNAGHTVVNQYGEFKLHLIPSGIFYPHTNCLIGTGCVVNPAVLIEELDSLDAAGVDTTRLIVSERAQMVMPYHRLLDGLQESASGNRALGTTKRGIGPAYSDKGARRGLRLGDLLRPEWLKTRLEQALTYANRELGHFNQPPIDSSELLEQCRVWRDKIGHRLIDPQPLIRRAYEQGANILLEGQLAAMRDLDWGTYPYVTSSNPTATFAPVGAGLPPQALSRVVGVVKAYTTAVGAGPVPTDQGDNSIARWLREKGSEYGATTGRPRRCGWFDAVALNYVSYLNGFTELAVTKLDVLDGMSEIKICTGYHLPDGSTINYVPDTPIYETVEPIYESWPGWPENSTNSARAWAELPVAAQNYLKRIEELVGIPIQYVSVGPKRAEMFELSVEMTTGFRRNRKQKLLQSQQEIEALSANLKEQLSRQTELLVASEQQYRSLFDDSPFSIWIEDFSQARLFIDSLRQQGVQDFKGYFEQHPEAVNQCIALIDIIDVSRATLELYEAENKEALLSNIDPVFDEEAYGIFREEFSALAEGQTTFEGESIGYTLTGKKMNIKVQLSIAPGHEQSWDRVYVSVTDITQLVAAEKELAQLKSQAD